AQLADKVGLSATPCWKRVQKLEAGGVITRRVALVDPEKIGVDLIVYVAIEAGDHTPDWLRTFSRTIFSRRRIRGRCLPISSSSQHGRPPVRTSPIR
ncbi:MAG: Lrp/AsnC family transcriptional regulator, partial [Actinomycetota bacterium]